MSAITAANRCYPVVDDFGVARASVLIYSGREWECHQRMHRVVVAISFALGEKAENATAYSNEKARYELARRAALRPPGFSLDVVGWLVICDEQNCQYALVSVLRDREAECQAVASSVCFAISRFDRRPMYIRVYEA